MTNEKTYHSSEFPKPQENMSTKMNKLTFRNYSLEFTGSSFTWVDFQNYILWLLIIGWLWNNSCYKIHVSEMCYSVPYCICISKINTTILFIFLSYTHTQRKKPTHFFPFPSPGNRNLLSVSKDLLSWAFHADKVM